MKRNNLVLRLCLVLGAVSYIAFLFYYPTLPDTVPIHWNMAGEMDGWGPKGFLLFFAALPFLTALLMGALPALDPRWQNYARHRIPYNIFTATLTVVFILLTWTMILAASGAGLPVGRIIPGMMGVLLVILGNWMPQIKPNYFMGIRTPWALENETVWRKTHRAGGILFVVCGALTALTALLPLDVSCIFMAWILVLLLGCVWLFVYSYMEFKKIKARKDDTDAEN